MSDLWKTTIIGLIGTLLGAVIGALLGAYFSNHYAVVQTATQEDIQTIRQVKNSLQTVADTLRNISGNNQRKDYHDEFYDAAKAYHTNYTETTIKKIPLIDKGVRRDLVGLNYTLYTVENYEANNPKANGNPYQYVDPAFVEAVIDDLDLTISHAMPTK